MNATSCKTRDPCRISGAALLWWIATAVADIVAEGTTSKRAVYVRSADHVGGVHIRARDSTTFVFVAALEQKHDWPRL